MEVDDAGSPEEVDHFVLRARPEGIRVRPHPLAPGDLSPLELLRPFFSSLTGRAGARVGEKAIQRLADELALLERL